MEEIRNMNDTAMNQHPQHFSMEVDWCSCLADMTDVEAGRFIKSISSFILTGKLPRQTRGKEQVLTGLALRHIQSEIADFYDQQAQQSARIQEIREKRSKAARNRWDEVRKKEASRLQAKKSPS